MRTLHPFAIEPTASSSSSFLMQDIPQQPQNPANSNSTRSPSPPPAQFVATTTATMTGTTEPPGPASNKPQPSPNGQLPTWTTVPPPPAQSAPSESSIAGPSTLPQAAGAKRKLDDADTEEAHKKIRRIVRDHVSQDPSRVVPMTTVICLHAAVAQKSYGSEKRFLCPPPVVHIEGPLWQMRQQQLSMAVISETGERSFEQKSPLDINMTASFKFLHVTGTAKAKSFQLTLDIAETPPATITSEGAEVPTARPWASFDSAPVTIISKPSKKTAKTRNISSCILAGGPVSLFNRINAQTVRTKYMTIDHGQLCASNTAWSAFNVNVVRRPTEALAPGVHPVTYGCEIVLSDTHTGIATGPLIIRKVDKGRVSVDDGGPVSQMQKIALQRVNPDGSRHYLSAAGPIAGPAAAAPSSSSSVSTQGGTHPLVFSTPRVRDELKDGVRVISDEVEDYLCWTIVGISKFQYTFFDAIGQNNSIPELPITPFPTLFTAPVYRSANNTIELTVSNFFYDNPKTGGQSPLDVYLGNLGPLRTRIYQTSPPGPLTTISAFSAPIMPLMDSATGSSVDLNANAAPVTRPVGNSMHTIVMVEMPDIADVIRALKEDGLPPNGELNADDHEAREGRNGGGSAEGPGDIAGRSLPLLFIRTVDGVGYHSGRTITCESVIPMLDLGAGAPGASSGGIDTGWLAAAQAAAAAEGGLHGWTLRVL